MTKLISLADFEKTILSCNGKQISFTIRSKYARPLMHWGYKRFPSSPFPKVSIVAEDSKEYVRIVFLHGTIQEQINDIPLRYEDVKFSWLELARYML